MPSPWTKSHTESQSLRYMSDEQRVKAVNGMAKSLTLTLVQDLDHIIRENGGTYKDVQVGVYEVISKLVFAMHDLQPEVIYLLLKLIIKDIEQHKSK